MKRFFKIFFISIFVLITIAVTAAFIFLKTFKLDNFKNQLLAQASNTLGAKVGMETLHFTISLDHGVVLKASGISIDDRPEFSQEKIFSLKEANLQLDLRSFIFNRQIIVTRVILEEPQLNLVRNKNGEINAQKLIPSPRQKDSAETKIEEMSAQGVLPRQTALAAEDSTQAVPLPLPSAPAINIEKPQDALKPRESLSLPDLLVRSIIVKDGILSWTDELMDPAMKVIVKNIDLKISNLSFDKEFPFDVNLSVLSDQDNIQAKGFLKIDKNNSQIFLNQFEAKTDLSVISFEQLFNLLPQLSQIGLEDSANGEIIFEINELTANTQGLTRLACEAHIQAGRMKFKQLASAFEDINADMNISQSAVHVTQSSINFAEGSISVTAQLEDYLKEQKFQINAQMDRVLIEKLIDQTKWPVQAQGKINGDFDLTGTGFTLESLKQSLNGSGHIEMVEGQLMNLNILQLVMGTLSKIRDDAQEKLNQNLPKEYKDILEGTDTSINKLTSDISLKGDRIVVQPVEIEAQGFLVNAEGSLDFDQNCSAQAHLLMAEDLSQAIASGVPELSYLSNNEGQIYIPFEPYQGKLAKFKMLPDYAYLLEHVGKAVGDQKLDELIDENVPEGLKDLLKDIKNEILKGF